MGAAFSHLGSGERCRCGHCPAKHSVSGMDGECVTCPCTTYTPRDRVTAPHRTPAVARVRVSSLLLDVQVADCDSGRGRSTPDRHHRKGT